jgi:hypothetical protein
MCSWTSTLGGRMLEKWCEPKISIQRRQHDSYDVLALSLTWWVLSLLYYYYWFELLGEVREWSIGKSTNLGH